MLILDTWTHKTELQLWTETHKETHTDTNIDMIMTEYHWRNFLFN